MLTLTQIVTQFVKTKGNIHGQMNHLNYFIHLKLTKIFIVNTLNYSNFMLIILHNNPHQLTKK